jgi:hypothetical protein
MTARCKLFRVLHSSNVASTVMIAQVYDSHVPSVLFKRSIASDFVRSMRLIPLPSDQANIQRNIRYQAWKGVR